MFIPLDWVIGGREGVGRGWVMLMECLSTGRGISLPAVGASGGKFCARTTGAYARVRRQFNLPIGRFGHADEVADLVTFLSSERASLLTGTCINVDGGQSQSLI